MARRTASRGPVAAVGNALLTLAAIGGTLCIALVLLAALFHVTLIMFKTGSMSPTIPAGSLAVVREIVASEVRVGDVVTVDRAGALPITHRVTSVAPAGGGLVSITLRGDANPSDDPAPYLVSRVRIVLWSIPQLAYIVSSASNPMALGGITLGATGIVTWAFWPREERGGSAAKPRRRRTHGAEGARHARAAGVVLLAGAVAAGTLLPTQDAMAAVTEDTIVGSAITLTSIGDHEAMGDLVPGTDVLWQVGVNPHPASPGVVDVSLVASGGLVSDANGLWLSVRTCEVRWVGQSCASGGTVALAPAAASAALGSGLAIASAMPTNRQLWVLVRAYVPPHPVVPAAGFANLSLIASGSGDTVVAGSSAGTTAFTGVDLGRPLGSALCAIAAGLALAFAARLRRRRAGAEQR